MYNRPGRLESNLAANFFEHHIGSGKIFGCSLVDSAAEGCRISQPKNRASKTAQERFPKPHPPPCQGMHLPRLQPAILERSGRIRHSPKIGDLGGLACRSLRWPGKDSANGMPYPVAWLFLGLDQHLFNAFPLLPLMGLSASITKEFRAMRYAIVKSPRSSTISLLCVR